MSRLGFLVPSWVPIKFKCDCSMKALDAIPRPQKPGMADTLVIARPGEVTQVTGEVDAGGGQPGGVYLGQGWSQGSGVGVGWAGPGV